MQLHLMSWPEVETYLAKRSDIIIPIGSTEQHGPTGLIGTDCICPEAIALRAAEKVGALVGPTFNVGSAQHHMGFAGSMTLRPSTFVAVLFDWITSLTHHGFTHIYLLNGHGGNVPSVEASFAEVYASRSLSGHKDEELRPLRCKLQNWWELKGVMRLCRELFPNGHGSHATPSEVAVTQFVYPDAIKAAKLDPKIAPIGPIMDAADYKRRFPDGRIGSDPSQASVDRGEKLVTCAVDALADAYREFVTS